MYKCNYLLYHTHLNIAFFSNKLGYLSRRLGFIITSTQSYEKNIHSNSEHSYAFKVIHCKEIILGLNLTQTLVKH